MAWQNASQKHTKYCQSIKSRDTCLIFIFIEHPYNEVESDKHVVYADSCSECEWCLRLYLWDAEDSEGIGVWRTWLDSRSVCDFRVIKMPVRKMYNNRRMFGQTTQIPDAASFARLTVTSSLCHENTLDWEIGVSLLLDRESGTISLLHCDNLTLSLDTLNVF